MKDYLKLAVQFKDKGVRSESNLPLFEAALKNAQEPGEAPLTSWDVIRILQAIVWLEWCYVFNFKVTLQLPMLVDIESFQEELKSFGLSMEKTIRENLNDEKKEPKPNIESNPVSGNDAKPQGESNGSTQSG